MKMDMLQIQTTSVCAGKCIFCPYVGSWAYNNPGAIKEEIFNKIIKETAHIKFNRVLPYLMNEPLADLKIFERIQKLKDLRNFNTMEISTNASLLKGNIANKLIDILEDVNNEVWISFHGTNEQNYTKNMGLNFKETLSNICNFLVKADGRLKVIIRGAGHPRINRTDSNNFCGVDYFNFWTEQLNQLGLRNRPEISYFTYHDRAGNLNKDLSFNYRRKSLEGLKCWRTNSLHFLYTGEIILCCMDYNKECVVGDITKDSLKDILNSQRRKMIIDKIEGRLNASNDFICKRCISPGG